MAIRPNNLTPNRAVVEAPRGETSPRRYGNLINGPFTPQFGGAEAVTRTTKRAPYGTVRHVGRKGKA